MCSYSYAHASTIICQYGVPSRHDIQCHDIVSTMARAARGVTSCISGRRFFAYQNSMAHALELSLQELVGFRCSRGGHRRALGGTGSGTGVTSSARSSSQLVRAAHHLVLKSSRPTVRLTSTVSTIKDVSVRLPTPPLYRCACMMLCSARFYRVICMYDVPAYRSFLSTTLPW